MKKVMVLLAMGCLAGLAPTSPADEPIYSGLQVGEKLLPFTVRGVFDDEAGKELDFVQRAAAGPIVLIFVHDVNRPSIAMMRILSGYTASRAKDGLATGVVWLTDDATEAEMALKRMRHALAEGAPIGISVDGREGPGTYGLNRNVTLTILIGKDNKVTANYALVQPSLQADLPKILDSVVAVAGGKAPKIEDLAGFPAMAKAQPNREAENLRPLLAPVIRRDASPEEVEKAALAVEEHIKNNVAARREVGRIAKTIVDAGKLSTYGTPKAQEYLSKWAKIYGSPTQ
jgi:hypothetical protein